MSRLSKSGDTIVEVLIALVIVASVLAGAFLVAQKSAGAVQDSKERDEALQVLQGQVESVRAYALKQSDSTTGVYSSTPKYFCVDSSNNVKPLPPSLVVNNLNGADFSAYNSTGCQFGPGNRYNVAVWYNPEPSGNDTFSFLAQWDNANGRRSQEQLNYRIFPGIISPPTPTPPACSPSQIVLALDVSESLDNNFAPGKTRRDELKMVAGDFMNNSGVGPGHNSAAIVVFTGHPKNQPTAQPFSEILQPMTTDAALLNYQIQNNLPDIFGTTYMPPLTKDIPNAWINDPSLRKILIFVSDGENWEDQPQHGGPGNNAVFAITDNMKNNQGITIFTVSVGTDSNFAALKGMASPGDFASGDNAAQLEFDFQTLANELNCGG